MLSTMYRDMKKQILLAFFFFFLHTVVLIYGKFFWGFGAIFLRNPSPECILLIENKSGD